jgi:DNA-binding IclR family transcriptional regulator
VSGLDVGTGGMIVANSKSGESVLQRVVRVISVFNADQPSKNIAAIARRADLPVSTTYRLVNDLIDEGLLQHAENGEVQLGVRLWELASRGSRVLTLRDAALPFMEQVHATVRQHTTLGVLDSGDLLYVERLSAGSSAVSIARTARRLPIYACSSGLVLLAFSPTSVQNNALAQPFRKFTKNTITDPKELRRRLADTRQRGFAIMEATIIDESTGVAVPIYGPRNDVIAALNVIVSVGEENLPTTIPLLKSAARGISRAMGWKR